MQPAVFIAKLIGPTFVAIGVGILLNGQFYDAVMVEALHSPTLIYFYGLMALVTGLAMLAVYRAWTRDWRVIVTILGWLIVIGGVLRIVLPDLIATIGTNIYSGTPALQIVAVIVLVLGGFLSFKGYWSRP